MRKVKSLFERNRDGDRLVRNEVVPGSEWVQTGRGVPTIKWDGTAVAIIGTEHYKRYDAKHGKTPPNGFIPCQDADTATGHWPGWVPVGTGDPGDRWIKQAFAASPYTDPWTYEAVGPKINGNPYDLKSHHLFRHGQPFVGPTPPRDFDGLRDWFTENPQYEGIVWWSNITGSGAIEMVKIKRRDFGLKWPTPEAHSSIPYELLFESGPEDWESRIKDTVDAGETA